MGRHHHSLARYHSTVSRRPWSNDTPGDHPSERSFAEEYEVAYTTVRHAMAVLRERGIIVTVHGRGTFVAPREPRSTQT